MALSGTTSGTVTFDITFDPDTGLPVSVVPDLSGLTVTATKFKHSLGVDVNGNGVLDELVVSPADFVLSLDGLLFDSVDVGSLMSGGVPSPVAITAATATFAGLVRDASTDPPFSFPLSGPIVFRLTTVPEPPILALLAPGLLLLLARRRRHTA